MPGASRSGLGAPGPCQPLASPAAPGAYLVTLAGTAGTLSSTVRLRAPLVLPSFVCRCSSLMGNDVSAPTSSYQPTRTTPTHSEALSFIHPFDHSIHFLILSSPSLCVPVRPLCPYPPLPPLGNDVYGTQAPQSFRSFIRSKNVPFLDARCRRAAVRGTERGPGAPESATWRLQYRPGPRAMRARNETKAMLETVHSSFIRSPAATGATC